MEMRIWPETGQELIRGVYPLKGLSEPMDMPGCYTADG